MDVNGRRKRNAAFDLLKVIAAFLVVLLHCTAFYMGYLEAGTAGFRFCMLLNTAARMGVPVFVMVSGAIFLDPDKETSVKRLWLHTILRLIVVYLVWAFVYDYKNIGIALFTEHSILHAMEILLDAPYHFWFLPMIIGIYALVPMLRTWLKHAGKQELQYFLILFLAVQIFRETFQTLFPGRVTQSISDFFRFEIISSYIGYYILGFYLFRYGLSKKIKIILYAAVIPCLAAGYFYSDPFLIFTFVPVVALFQFIIDMFGEKEGKIISSMAKDTLGIYLMHLLFATFFNRIFLDGLSFPYEWKALMLTLLCFLGSAVVAAVLRRIPVVGRYLV